MATLRSRRPSLNRSSRGPAPRSPDPTRDDAGVRLRTLRLRRGMSQVALAELACISPALVSMVENGQRTLSRADHIFALADALRVSPRYLTEGREDTPTPGQPTPRTEPFPARSDRITLARHQQLARQLIRLAHQDGRAAGNWVRRLAREPEVSPWLLIDQLAILHAARPELRSTSGRSHAPSAGTCPSPGARPI